MLALHQKKNDRNLLYVQAGKETLSKVFYRCVGSIRLVFWWVEVLGQAVVHFTPYLTSW
jgi:hypothetical protein